MPLDRMGANLAYRRFDPQKRATVQTDGGMLCGERTWLTLSNKVSQLARVATSSRSFSKKNGAPRLRVAKSDRDTHRYRLSPH
jgi:hypothetical protein